MTLLLKTELLVRELGRLRTPCGEPVKPESFPAALSLFSTLVPLNSHQKPKRKNEKIKPLAI
jgi:hypothetical protein